MHYDGGLPMEDTMDLAKAETLNQQIVKLKDRNDEANQLNITTSNSYYQESR